MQTSIKIDSLISAIRDVCGDGEVQLHEPEFLGNEKTYVADCVDSGWVSSVGGYVDRFEQMLEDFTGAAKAVATVNGTAALHAGLLLAGVNQQDEVLIPTLTFIATANAVMYCGAMPHFCDSEISTLGIDADRLDNYLDSIAELRREGCFNRLSGRKISALIVMHTFGHPSDMARILRLCTKWHIALVEDAAESLGSSYAGKHTGRFGRVGTLSFNGNKIVTTGGGGALLFDDPELGVIAKHLTTTARVPHKWSFIHDRVGFNYRMPNLNAALGCAQLERLSGMLTDKRRLAANYRTALHDLTGFRFVDEPENSTSNFWLNAVLLDSEFSSQRDEVLQATNGSGLMTRPAWTLMHKLPMFRDCPRMNLSIAEDIESRLINLPSSAKLGRRDLA